MAATMQWGDYVDPASYLYDDPSFGYPVAPISIVGDRDGGMERRLIDTETHLAAIRGQARALHQMGPFGQAITDTLRNYVVGSGFAYKITPGDETAVDDGLIRCVSRCVDQFLDTNDWVGSQELEGEILERTIRDGEAFVSLAVEDDLIVPRLIDPEQVSAPRDSRQLEEWIWSTGRCDYPNAISWTFGVATPEADIAKHLGYHVQYDAAGVDFDFVSRTHCEHLKVGTDRNVKRGLSKFFAIRHDLEREAKLRKNVTVGAALQAAIAWAEEMPAGVNAAQAAAIGSGTATSSFQQGTSGGGSRTIRTTKYEPGTVVRVGAGQKFVSGPMGSTSIPNWLLIGQYVIRAMGARFSIPEYMISGDASNANYSSTLVSESAFTKAREADQRFFAKRYRNIIWKMLVLACRLGRFVKHGIQNEQQLAATIDLTVTCPQVAASNKAEANTITQVQVTGGIKSLRTWSDEAGLDWEEERKRIAEERSQGLSSVVPPVGSSMPGVPPGSSPEAPAVGRIADAQFSGVGMRDFARNWKQTDQTLDKLGAGEITELRARMILAGLGYTEDQIGQLIADSKGETVSEALAEHRQALARARGRVAALYEQQPQEPQP